MQTAWGRSMSRKADCWDNAPSESFFGTLKEKLIYYMEAFSNPKSAATRRWAT